MEDLQLTRFATLGHPQRMAVFRLLMRRYPDALPAGEIAQVLGLKASTLSVYLAALSNCGLIAHRRRGTSLLYRVEMQAAQALVSHLFSDCCRGRADLCPTIPHLGDRRNVLFVCSGNSARSIFAEAILRAEGAGRFAAWSAGTRPRASIDPIAADVLQAAGHDTNALAPKDIAVFRSDGAPAMDVVLTVCDRSANEDSAPWPGQPVSAHWGLPDPVAATGAPAAIRRGFETTYQTLQTRIRAFAALPFDALDRAALQRELDTLGLKEPA